MVGGAIVVLVKKCKALHGAAESAGKTGRGFLSTLAFFPSETIENLKDLVAESKMEWEAEKAAMEEVSLHSKKQKTK